MKVLLISNVDQRDLGDRVRARGSSLVQLSASAAANTLVRTPALLSADVILLDLALEGTELQPPDAEAVISTAGAIRKLPDYSAMSDGRKWSQVPIVWKKYGETFTNPKPVLHDMPEQEFWEMPFPTDITLPLRELNQISWKYYNRLSSDYDEVGLLVTEDAGRLRVAEAFRPRRQSNTRYYYGPADMRRSRIFTLARNAQGDENDLSDFADLIDPRMRSTEHKLHRFLADAPSILTLDPVDVVSHARIGAGAGRSELDFFYRPYFDRDIEGSWTILEIKRADQSLMAGLGGGDPRLTAAVLRAVRQVKRYGQLIDDPHQRERVIKALGGIPRDARLAVLIGRRPGADRYTFDREIAEQYPDISIVTYDDLFETREQALSTA